MELTEARVQEIVRKVITIAMVTAVSLVAGWWVPRVHYVVALASLAVLGLAFFALTKPEVGVYGLLFFAQIATVSGLGLQLPLGMNEFNLIFVTLVFVSVGEFAVTKRWKFKMRERSVGNYLYLYYVIILISTMRAYMAFPHWDFVRSGLSLGTRSTVVTSQLLKPAMYVGLFFFGYNFAQELGQRRRYVMALGVCLVLYATTMFMQLLNVFPVLAGFAGGKEAGGILGSSIALGHLLGMYLVLFYARKPYFDTWGRFLFAVAVAVIGVVALASTLIRLGWLMGILGWLMVSMTTRRKPLMILGVLCLGAVLASSPLWLPERVKVYFEKSTVEQTSLDAVLSGRLSIWQSVEEYLHQDPKRYIWGGGKFDFAVRGPDFGLPRGFAVHQSFLQTLVDEGMIGVLVVVWIFIRIITVLWRDWHSHPSTEVQYLSRLLLIITFLFFVSSAPWDSRQAAWYWFLLGMCVAAKEEWTRKQPVAATIARPVPQPRLMRAGAAFARPVSPPSV